MMKFVEALLWLFSVPMEQLNANDWARLEFGRDAIESDFEGRIL